MPGRHRPLVGVDAPIGQQEQLRVQPGQQATRANQVHSLNVCTSDETLGELLGIDLLRHGRHRLGHDWLRGGLAVVSHGDGPPGRRPVLIRGRLLLRSSSRPGLKKVSGGPNGSNAVDNSSHRGRPSSSR